MNDMYNNSNNQNGGSYGGPQPGQSSIQSQLQYQYQAPKEELEEPITMGEWLITMLIMMIPCANIIMMFVWAFSSSEKKSKSNYFKAYLIFFAVTAVFAFIMVMVLSAAVGNAIDSMGGYYY